MTYGMDGWCNTSNTLKVLDFVSREAAIDACLKGKTDGLPATNVACDCCAERIRVLPSAQPDLGKYEYHYDHTDCIYYSSEERHTCPSTCAQYRDGWNDAMQYIFRGGDGYRPYRRDERYEE